MKKSFENRSSQPRRGQKHDLGQNFLYDEALLRSLVAGTGVGPQDDILEIGPGEGTLTSILCETGRRVIAVEVDHDLIPFLMLKREQYPNLQVVEADIRKISLPELTDGFEKPYCAVANIPYNITSPILELLWKQGTSIRTIALMVQKEVADKLVACPGEDAYGLLSVHCRYYSVPSVIADVPAECFSPPPKVDSAFVRMDVRPEPLLTPDAEKRFLTLVRAGYNLRRKTLMNALKCCADPSSVLESLKKMGKSETVRAEELSVEDWIALSRMLTEKE